MKSVVLTFITTITLFTVAAIPVRIVAQEQPQAVAITPTPVISSLHPSASSAKSGAAGAVVFVAGQNFVAGVTTVQFLGSSKRTTVFNSEILAFELTAADLAKPQTVMIGVVNRSGTQAFKSNLLPFVVLP
jgi:IPT/TIG domain